MSLQNNYIIIEHSSNYIISQKRSGKFKDEQIKIENIHFDEDVNQEDSTAILKFDYTILSGKKYREKSIQKIDDLVAEFMNNVLKYSIEYAERILNNSKIVGDICD